MYEEVIRLVSQEEFERCLAQEHKGLCRKSMYIVYEYMIKKFPKLEKEYELKNQVFDVYARAVDKKRWKFLPDYMLRSQKNWEFIDVSSLSDIKEYFFKKTQVRKSKGDLEHYIAIILKHMTPINKNMLQEDNNEEFSYGVYGIYENGELVYIGMTMRDFMQRWEEHQRGIKTGSKELIFYSKINKKSKIEFKILVDVSKIESNSKITKRDVQSMELGLIRVFNPKYNYAGRTVEYKY